MKLNVTTRTQRGKANNKLRKEDQLPCVIYAKHIADPLSISCRRQDFVKAYKTAGSSTPLTLVSEDGIDELVLVHDMQIDPVTNFVTHVDFLGIKKGEKVSAHVELVLDGKAPVVGTTEARVQQTKYDLHIQALPKDLPHEILVDISSLETVVDVISVADLTIPQGVEVLDDTELSVVTVIDMSGAGEEDATDSTDETEETTESA